MDGWMDGWMDIVMFAFLDSKLEVKRFLTE
jgi:hypothetical protein